MYESIPSQTNHEYQESMERNKIKFSQLIVTHLDNYPSWCESIVDNRGSHSEF